jgi:hypothetical protein
MKRLSDNLLLVLCGAAALAGCGSASVNHGTGGTNGGSGGSTGGGTVALMPDGTGWIDGTSNSLMVQGAWYGYGDAYGDTSCGGAKCTDPMAGGHMASECSMIMQPPVPAVAGVGFPNTDGKMCTMGIAAKVIPIVVSSQGTGMDYSNVWGAGIGFDLNAMKGAAECDKKPTFNATDKHVTGLQFDIDTVPTGLRVEFPIPATDNTKNGADYWGASGTSYPASPVVSGTNMVTWDKIGEPGSAPLVMFDPTMIESIQFHVPTSGAAQSYSFCISNVKLLTSD